MNGRFNKPVYLFLFALFPVLSLLSANINEMALVEGLRATVFALVAAGVGLLALGFRGWQWDRAALVVSPAILGFLSYSHLYKVFTDSIGLANSDMVYAVVSGIWLLLLFVLAALIWFRVKRSPAAG